MITGLSHTTVWVLDQNSAKKFYTEKLGFDVRDDTVMTNEYMPGTSGFRWLTVGPKQQPDLRMLLAEPKPPMVDEEAAKAIRALVAKGAFGAGVLDTDDCRKTYEDLRKKGVQFLQEPADRPYGVEAVFRDDSGNWYSLTERKGR
ncbi:MAG: VOC family protein [Chloroflexi bacterium]|nr:MAG: VOC family protein [Chloroflexota bacterium]TMG49430.1 MAG: VOC family protein [Chloroflexota bacterium]